MEKEFESKKQRLKIERYHLNFLSNSKIDYDPRFVYLKSQLSEFYQNVYSNQNYSTNPTKLSQWNKNLHHSLNSLLSELVLTPNQESQLTLLDKAHKWYLSNLPLIPITEKSPSQKSSINTRNVSLPSIDPIRPTHLSPKTNSPLYFPKPHRVQSKQNIINSSEAKYFEMLEEEKIGLRTSQNRKKFSNIRSKTPVAHTSSSVVEKENDEVYKNNIKEPELSQEAFKYERFITPNYDFRANNRFRVIEGIERNKIFSRVQNNELNKIHLIKKKFAKRKVIVDSKILEFAERSKDQIDDKYEFNKLPTGGEMLMRYKKVQKKSTKKQKKKKTSKDINNY